jgi:hypothetical protein
MGTWYKDKEIKDGASRPRGLLIVSDSWNICDIVADEIY